MWGGSQHIYFFPFGYSINLDCIFTTILQGHLSHKWTNCIVGVCTWSLYWTDFSILLGYIYPLQQYHTISMDLGIWQCKSFNCVCLYYVLKKWSPHHFPGQIPCLYRIKSKLFTRPTTPFMFWPLPTSLILYLVYILTSLPPLLHHLLCMLQLHWPSCKP